jgi:HEAT repeat protein
MLVSRTIMSLTALLFVVSTSVLSAHGNEAEAHGLVGALLRGEVAPPQAINRFTFLDAQRQGAFELTLALARITDERQRDVVLSVIAALAGPPPLEEVERALLSALATDDLSRQLTAARGLTRMRSARVVPLLLGMLKDERVGPRRQAAQSLGELQVASAGPALAAALAAEKDLETRLDLVAALGHVGDRQQLPVLLALLTDGSETTRVAAARSLCLLGDARGTAFARTLLASTDPHERLQGVLLFEGLKAKQAAPVLSPVLADADGEVRATAARILAEGGDKSKVDWLVVESTKATGDARWPYEKQLEKLRLTDEDRRASLKRAGLE